MKNLSLGDNYQPKDAYFRTAEGEITRRNYGKNERKISNETLPRLAIQIRGIFPDVDSFKKKGSPLNF